MLSVIFNSICLEYQVTPVDDDENDAIDDNNKQAAAVILNVNNQILNRKNGIFRPSVFSARAAQENWSIVRRD